MPYTESSTLLKPQLTTTVASRGRRDIIRCQKWDPLDRLGQWDEVDPWDPLGPRDLTDSFRIG